MPELEITYEVLEARRQQELAECREFFGDIAIEEISNSEEMHERLYSFD